MQLVLKTNRHFEHIPTQALLADTLKLLKFCWEDEKAFVSRHVFSLLEICMYECEARGFMFIPIKDGLKVMRKPDEPLKASDLNNRWDEN